MHKFLTLILIFLSYSDPIERIRASFERWVKEMPEEKVFLHLDRDVYAAGETIWVKAYVTLGSFHLPSSLSQTLHLELYDSTNELVKRELIYTAEGFSGGQLELPDTLATGVYSVRAYTQWMRNMKDTYFFEQAVEIYGETSLSHDLVIKSDSISIQFFPEGGSFVEGLFSKVGFKVIGGDGLSRQVEGVILADDVEVAQFKSNHLGMGIFPLTPERGKSYTAKLKGQTYLYELPTVLSSGIVMAVNNSKDSDFLQVKLMASSEFNLEEVYILAQCRGLMSASAKVDMRNRLAYIRFPKEQFPSGIVQLMIVDQLGNPLVERLAFIEHEDQLRMSIQTAKEVYRPREEVQLALEVRDSNDVPVQGNFSLRVIDTSHLPPTSNPASLRTHLLMTSELRGFIESPEYYFDESYEDRLEALDFLLLTQGWRKYSFQEAMNGALPETAFAVERGVSINGNIVEKESQKRVPEAEVSFLSLTPVISTQSAFADDYGAIELTDLFFYDSSEVLIEIKSAKNKKPLELLIDDEKNRMNFSHTNVLGIQSNKEEPKKFWQEHEFRKSIEQAFSLEESEILLDAIELSAKKIPQLKGGSRIYEGGTVKMQVAGNPALENLFHPLDVINGRVAGVQIRGSGQSRTVIIQGMGSLSSSIEPLLMVDDVPVNLEYLYTLPVEDISEVVVWKGADTAIFGSRGANGAIGFYTKRGSFTNSELKSESAIELPKGLKGYQIEKTFYTPSYEFQQSNSPKPDRRVTLFWEPMIETDDSGKASIAFFNHDLESEILVEIQGLSYQGVPGSQRLLYKIKN